MPNPPIFIDPQGDSGLLKKMLQTGQAEGRNDKVFIIDIGPAHRELRHVSRDYVLGDTEKAK